jgi:outer membrane protein OmpA-like peptidoglycan-associated protein
MKTWHGVLGPWVVAGVMLVSACAQTKVAPPPAVRLALAQTDRGVLIWLPDNVLFEFGKSSLSPEAGAYLDRVAALLNEKTDHQLVLEGHTDNVGAVELNQRLSEQRAKVVADALLLRAVSPARLKTAGFGLTKPLAPNDSDVGRKLNRRVEIIVLDETVAHLTQGEPANAFEDAFAKLRAALEPQLGQGPNPGVNPADIPAAGPASTPAPVPAPASASGAAGARP